MSKILFTPYIKNNKGAWVPEKVGVDAAVFTGMQENAVATICEASFKRNVVFPNVHSIVSRVSSVRKKLQKIFSINNKPVFNLNPDITFSDGSKWKLHKGMANKKEWEWMNTFWLQNKKLLQVFGNPAWTQFDRDDAKGFMQYITKLVLSDRIVKPYKMTSKDAWNPADIWLIKNDSEQRRRINHKIPKNKSSKLEELNILLRTMYKERKIVGISLKKMSLNYVLFEHVNVSEIQFANYRKLSFAIGNIRCRLDVDSGTSRFSTQDTVIEVKNGNEVLATFQIKGNTSNIFSNLKFEGTNKKYTGARLGKAPLELVSKIKLGIYNKEYFKHQNFPDGDEKSWTGTQNKYAEMFTSVKTSAAVRGITIDFGGITTKEHFKNNFGLVFGTHKKIKDTSDTSMVANSKLMQLNFLDNLLTMEPDQINNYMTDLLLIAEKKGSKHQFGPFGKLY